MPQGYGGSPLHATSCPMSRQNKWQVSRQMRSTQQHVTSIGSHLFTIWRQIMDRASEKSLWLTTGTSSSTREHLASGIFVPLIEGQVHRRFALLSPFFHYMHRWFCCRGTVLYARVITTSACAVTSCNKSFRSDSIAHRFAKAGSHM